MLKYLTLFCIASAFSFLLTPLVRFLSGRLGAMDLPGERKVHGQPIPRLGGLAIFVGFNLVLLVSSRFDFFYFPVDFLKEINFGWLFVASTIALALGAVDDFRRMAPGVKFFFQIVAGLIVAVFCPRIEVISLPFGTSRPIRTSPSVALTTPRRSLATHRSFLIPRDPSVPLPAYRQGTL